MLSGVTRAFDISSQYGKAVMWCDLPSAPEFILSNILFFILFSVDKNGDVCISILHEPGEDKYGYEKPEERWLPIHTVETIMISVISMLADPNGDSPANVDAAVSLASRRVLFFKVFSVCG